METNDKYIQLILYSLLLPLLRYKSERQDNHMTQSQYLVQLETLLDEFFSGESTNQRKFEIEQMLGTFSHQTNAWQLCSYFLTQSQNTHVLMFSLNVYERLSNSMWPGISVQERKELRENLIQVLKSRHKHLPTFITSKWTKFFVLVARTDWPQEYPEFFEQVFDLFQSNEFSYLGLTLLLSASEELANPRADVINTQRRALLRTQMLQQAPKSIRLLSALLHNNAKHLETMGASGINKNSFSSSANNLSVTRNPDEAHKQIITSLNCLAHFFTWIPLNQAPIYGDLLETLFYYAALGIDGSREVSNQHEQQGLAAIHTLYELVALGGIPQNYDEFLAHIFTLTCNLMAKIIEMSEGLSKLDDKYLERFSEYLRLFVNNHLKRVLNNPLFLVSDFLDLLFKYTFKQPQMDSYYQSFEIWHVFFDFIFLLETSQIEKYVDKESNLIIKYEDLFKSLLEAVLTKMQFSLNQEELQDLDDDCADEGDVTEWQTFILQSIEILAKLTELIPEACFQMICPLFTTYCSDFAKLNTFIQYIDDVRILNFTEQHYWQGLNALLRDIRSILQTLGRLAEHFCDSLFEARFQDTSYLTQQLVGMIKFCMAERIDKVEFEAPELFQPQFVQIEAGILSTIKAYVPWFSQYYSQLKKENCDLTPLVESVEEIVDICSTIILQNYPPLIQQCATDLLLSMVRTVRLPFLISMKSYQNLILAGCQKIVQLDAKSNRLFYNVLVCGYLLPWPDCLDKEQHWEQRGEEFNTFATTFTMDFNNLSTNLDLLNNKHIQMQAKPTIVQTLVVLTEWCSELRDHNKRIRGLLYDPLSPCIDSALHFFPIYIHQPDLLQVILKFFLGVFDSLSAQMGSQRCEKITQFLMTLLSKDQIENSIREENSIGSLVIENFINILICLSKSQNTTTTTFLPHIITFVLEQVYPPVTKQGTTSIKMSLFSLFSSILRYNWKSFFPYNILNASDPETEVIQNKEQFLAIMNILCEFFTESDITLFRENLLALTEVHNKNKIFHKYIFLQNMRDTFCSVFLQVLVQKSHELLQDEITNLMYNMAFADFDSFFSSFLPSFLENCDNLTYQQKKDLLANFRTDQDLPTFTQNLRQLCTDLRLYLIVNSATPASSVTLT